MWGPHRLHRLELQSKGLQLSLLLGASNSRVELFIGCRSLLDISAQRGSRRHLQLTDVLFELVGAENHAEQLTGINDWPCVEPLSAKFIVSADTRACG